MGKVVILNGSPRKHGYTSKALEYVRKGAESVGADIVEFDLNQKGIRGCQGCNYCWKHDGCSVRDTLTPLYADIKEADAIVVGSPNYFFTMTSQVKTWLDRMACMHEGDTPVARYPGKKFVTVFVQGNIVEDMFKPGYAILDESMKQFGWEQQEQIIVNGTLDIPDYKITEELQKRLFDAGAKLGEFKKKPLEEAKREYEQLLAEEGIWDPHGGKFIV